MCKQGQGSGKGMRGKSSGTGDGGAVWMKSLYVLINAYEYSEIYVCVIGPSQCWDE